MAPVPKHVWDHAGVAALSDKERRDLIAEITSVTDRIRRLGLTKTASLMIAARISLLEQLGEPAPPPLLGSGARREVFTRVHYYGSDSVDKRTRCGRGCYPTRVTGEADSHGGTRIEYAGNREVVSCRACRQLLGLAPLGKAK